MLINEKGNYTQTLKLQENIRLVNDEESLSQQFGDRRDLFSKLICIKHLVPSQSQLLIQNVSGVIYYLFNNYVSVENETS